MNEKTKVETTNLMLWVYSLHCWSDGAFIYFSYLTEQDSMEFWKDKVLKKLGKLI